MQRRIVTGLLTSILSLVTVQPLTAVADPAEMAKSPKAGSSDPKNVASQTKSLQYFNSIVLSGVGNLYVKQSDEQSLVVKAEPAILQLVKAFVKDETLFLDLQNASKLERVELNYFLNIKDVKNIQSFSSSSIFIEEPIKTDELTLSIKSFGEMNVNLNVSKLIVQIEGAGKLKAKGTAVEQIVKIDGAGEFIGNTLKGEKVAINITSAGVAKANASNQLVINIPQEGTVQYCGQPSISKEISKNGKVEPLEDGQCK
jgi:hypothetical protein